jgi:hypothetical protein
MQIKYARKNNLERQSIKRCKDFFPEVHLPLRNGYVSVEELVRENSHNKPGLFQPLSPFPLWRLTRAQIRAPFDGEIISPKLKTIQHH